MPSLDLEIDTTLRTLAVTAADVFVKQHQFPVKRSQIDGLLEIAVHEPKLLAGFAGKQRERAEKRLQGTTNESRKSGLENEIAFWKQIQEICKEGSKHPQSLTNQRNAAMPKELGLPSLPPGAKQTKEEDGARKKLRSRRLEWEDEWTRSHFGPFFRLFCAHYLQQMPPERGGHDEH